MASVFDYHNMSIYYFNDSEQNIQRDMLADYK